MASFIDVAGVSVNSRERKEKEFVLLHAFCLSSY